MALNHEVTGSVNYTVVGSPTIVDGVVSGFSGSDYLTIPSAISTASNFEICVKIDENSTSGDTCYPLGTDVPYGITFSTNAARLYLSSNGSSWDMAGEQTDINLPNNCYARVRFDGAKYIYDYSLDKTSWIVINTVNNSTKINSAISNIKLGGWWGAYYFTGSIDLNNTYIKVNGQALFGNCPVEVKHIDYGTSVGYTKVGSPTIVDGVVSGFSSSDYITIPYNNNDKKEVVFNFTTPSSFKNYDGLYDCYGAYIYLKSNGKMEAMYGSGGSNRWKEITGTLQTNTNYFLKIVTDDNAWYSYLSTDGNNYELQLTETQYMIYLFSGQAAKIGKTSYHGYWSGSIDLNKTYIKVNGNLWFYKPCTNYLVKDDKLVFADSGLYLAGPNTYTKVGSPVIVDNVASGFSGSDYITVPFDTTASSWEIILKAKRDTGTNDMYYISSNGLYGLTATEARIWLSSNGTSHNLASGVHNGPGTMPANTDCLLRFMFTGTQYTYDYSVDNGANWTNIAYVTSTEKLASSFTTLKIGQRGSSNYMIGTIDLNNTYIKVNDQLWFYGKNYASQNIAPIGAGYHINNAKVGCVAVGEPTIVDGVASDFSSNNYITLPTFNPGSSTWEIGCKFTTGSSIGDNIIYVFSKASADISNYRYGIAFRTTGQRKFELNFSLDGASWFGSTTPDLIVSTNTTYWTKEYWDGSAFKMDISTDGITYQNIATIASTTPNYSPLELVELGRWKYAGTNNWAWNGSIDLNNTYIKVNGDLWFDGKEVYPFTGYVDMRTQEFNKAPSGATLGKDE